LLRATRTGHILVNGTSGYAPHNYDILKEGLMTFDPSVIRALQQLGPLLVFAHEDTGRGDQYRDFIGELPDARRVLHATEGVLFQLPARVPMTSPGRPLPIASV